MVRGEAGTLWAGTLYSPHWLFACTCQGFHELRLLCQALPCLAIKSQVFICLAVSIVRWANVCSGI